MHILLVCFLSLFPLLFKDSLFFFLSEPDFGHLLVLNNCLFHVRYYWINVLFYLSFFSLLFFCNAWSLMFIDIISSLLILSFNWVFFLALFHPQYILIYNVCIIVIFSILNNLFLIFIWNLWCWCVRLLFCFFNCQVVTF